MIRGAALIAALFAGAAQAETAIVSAAYAGPVTRYGHDVLGVGHEWGALDLTLNTCTECASPSLRTVRFTLPDTMVFEDTEPRLVYLGSGSLPEILVVESQMTQGSRLALYGPAGRSATSAFTGQRHRWIAPVGAADMDGDGQTEIVAVVMPHLAKLLRVWHLDGDRLVPVAEAVGLTNHHFGSPVIESAIINCGTSAVVLTADADWAEVMSTALVDGTLTSVPFRPYAGPKSFQNLPICN